jgi:hypothetical protein
LIVFSSHPLCGAIGHFDFAFSPNSIRRLIARGGRGFRPDLADILLISSTGLLLPKHARVRASAGLFAGVNMQAEGKWQPQNTAAQIFKALGFGTRRPYSRSRGC